MKNSKIKPKYKSIKWYLRKISVVGCWYDCYVLTTSEFSSKIIGRAFDVSEERTIISGYPRNYIALSDDPLNYIPHNEHYHYEMVRSFKESGYRIIGYFPTFRDKKETLIFGSDQFDEILYFLDFCENLKIKIIGKFHFAGKNDKCLEEINAHQAFVNLSSDNDVYTFIRHIDLLITDYSSIYFDFLLSEKPIIFFPYDLKYYVEEDRGLIFKYDEYTPGPKVYNLKELEDLLKGGYNKFEKYYLDLYLENAAALKILIFDKPQKMMIKHLWDQIIIK
jgi:CDP-glycerol glycerophosphotransferase